MCRNRPEATRNGISSETPYRLCGGGQIVTIYTYLGNGIRHELCMKFVQSGYDLGVIDEGTQAKGGQA